MSSSSNTLNRLVLSTDSTAREQFAVPVSNNPRVRLSTRSSKSVRNAVYAHIRAIRVLGRTKINTAEVADALSLSVAEVNHAILSLEEKGVKVLNG